MILTWPGPPLRPDPTSAGPWNSKKKKNAGGCLRLKKKKRSLFFPLTCFPVTSSSLSKAPSKDDTQGERSQMRQDSEATN